jgi:hypothetical protein
MSLSNPTRYLPRNGGAQNAPTLAEVRAAGRPNAAPGLWSQWVLDIAYRHRHKLYLGLFLLYLLGFNGQWRIEPDSALYLGLARNIARHHGYVFRSHANHLAFPGPPVLFALGFKLSDSNGTLIDLVLMLLIAAATLSLTYRLFLLHADRRTAVLMTFGLGISRLFYRYSMELLSDMPFLLGVMAFLAGYEAVLGRGRSDSAKAKNSPGTAGARWYDWTLLLGGLGVAVVMRPAMWGLLTSIVLSALFPLIGRWKTTTTRPSRAISLIAITAIAMAAAFWLLDPRRSDGHVVIGGYEDALLEVKLPQFKALVWQIVHGNTPRLFDAAGCQALFGCRLGPGLNQIAGGVVLLIGVSLLRRRLLWGLWFIFTVTMMLMVVPLDRYFLEVLPLLIYGWWRAICWLEVRLRQPWGTRVFAALLVIGATTNLLRVGEMILEQRSLPFRQHYKEGRYAATGKVVALIQAQVGPDQWVQAPHGFGRILAFLSDRNVTEPSSGIPLEPAHQRVYVLEPIDEPVEQWLNSSAARLGPPVGASVQITKPNTETWRLRPVLPAGVPATQQ